MATFSNKRVFGYPTMVVAIVLIGFIGMGVWIHHMFTVGLGGMINAIFAVATMLVGIPTGIKVFNWLLPCGADEFASRPRCCSPSASFRLSSSPG